MKTIFKYMLLCLLAVNTINAQESKKSINLSNAEIRPYQIELTHNKTTHVLFPSSIEYVDLGSQEIIASKVEVSSNVLRLKTIKQDVTPTNFTVITSDGKYYSFNTTYKQEPTQLSYDLVKFEKQNSKQKSEVLLKDLGSTSPGLADLFIKAIIKKNKKELNVKIKNYGVEARLKSIYTQGGKLYFHLSIDNKSNLPYKVDYISFKIKDRRTTKRTTVQESSLTPVKVYREDMELASKEKQDNVFVLNQFTLLDKQVLVVEINERNGVRNQILKIKNSDLQKVKQLKEIRF